MHPDSNRSTMKNPNARDDRYERILRLHWIILERRALSRVSQRIRSRVDVSQIVNDAADEWIQIGVSLEKSHHGEQLSDERLIGLLVAIVEKRTTDSIRSEIAWKRGGRTITGGEEILDRCQDPNCITCTSAIEFDEMLSSVEQHLDATQRSVLRLRLDGYTELEIAKRLELSIDAVKGIRRSIVSVANSVMTVAHPERQKAKGKRQKAKGKKSSFEKNGNFSNGVRGVYD